MSRIWYLENINLFKILCPHKYSRYMDDHSYNLYKNKDYIYFENDAARKVYLIDKVIRLFKYKFPHPISRQ